MANGENGILGEGEAAYMLNNILLEENIIDPVFIIRNACEKGDGYFSYVVKVDAKGKNKTLSAILKIAPTISKLREVVPTGVFFKNEIIFYRDIYPAFITFRKHRRVDTAFIRIPKCYKTVDTECSELLILENMLECGFKIFGKSRQMDNLHVTLILKEYAKLHAVSFAMKEQENDRFIKLVENYGNYFAKISDSENFQNLFLDGCEKLKAVINPETEKNIYRSIENYKEGLIPFLKSLKNYSGNYGVVTHGDCWSNNMLFKYKDNSSDIHTEMCFIDFQISQVITPVMDLAYFFYVTATKDMLTNLNQYLKIYHDSLSRELSAMGCDVKRSYPFSAFRDEWKKFAKYGIMMAVVVFRIMFRADEEALGFEDELGSDTSVTNTFMKPSKYDYIINEKYRLLALHFYENGFF